MLNKTMNAIEEMEKSVCFAPGRVVEGVTEERELNPGVMCVGSRGTVGTPNQKHQCVNLEKYY